MPAATVAQADKLANKIVGRALSQRADGVISVRSDCRANKPTRRPKLFYCDTLVVGKARSCSATSTIRLKHKLTLKWKPETARCWVPFDDSPSEDNEEVVERVGLEPTTRAFSGHRSTD